MPSFTLIRRDVPGRCYRKTFHHIPACTTTLQRWQRHGVWSEINRTLRQLVRQDVGKNALPTAAAIDSQSVKTTEKKGRSMAMMAARRSKDVNDF